MAPSCKKRKFFEEEKRCQRYCTRSYVKQLHFSMPVDQMGPLFGSLPTEMLTYVLSYLDAPSLACFGATCKTLYGYCEEMWRPLCNRLNLEQQPTVLCVQKPLKINSIYNYDRAVELCISKKRYKISAIRNWLFSRWRCVICYRTGSQRIDIHVDVTLCETCHLIFYRRKCHAKEQFSLTEKDLRIIDSESYEFLVSDLITIARAKYGGSHGLKQRLDSRKQQKEERESDKQCSLITRENLVVSALCHQGSSYEEISVVDFRCMPFVGSPPSYPGLEQQAEDAAKWLISCKNRQETRYKTLVDEIKVRSGRCKGCQARVDFRLAPHNAVCLHVTSTEGQTKMKSILSKFKEDIAHYSKHGLLHLESGPYDIEEKSALELMNRHDRMCKLQKELDERKDSWPDILKEDKNPMFSQLAQDYIYKGVSHLENKGSRFQLRKAMDVARVIITTANGWDARKKEMENSLAEKGVPSPTKILKLESQMLIDDFIDNSVVVRGEHILACSAAEVAEKVSVIEGHEKEQPSSVARRCARIYAECNPKPDFKQLQLQRKKDLLRSLSSIMPITSYEDLENSSCLRTANDFINCGTTTSLFGYKMNTPNSVASLIKLKQEIYMNQGKRTNAAET
ncbi:uncharacterized protein LOC124433781 isoform X2 [Xenia sp. Carnegie-2017]|nr:uncharacterized protein LOC124433781 isoform X2 [Xenia sp. Carnegie-2017]